MANKETPQPYSYKEFPRVVYGPGDETVTINSEDERPDGYANFPGGYDASADADKAARAEKRAAAKQAKADKAAEELRAKTIAFLSEHNVEFAEDADTETLTGLAKQLEDHLAQQAAVNDNG